MSSNIILEDIYLENNEEEFPEIAYRKDIVSDVKPNFSLFADNEDHAVLKNIIKGTNNKKELKGINVVSTKTSIPAKLKEEQFFPEINKSISNSVLLEKAKAKKYTSKVQLQQVQQQQRSFK